MLVSPSDIHYDSTHRVVYRGREGMSFRRPSGEFCEWLEPAVPVRGGGIGDRGTLGIGPSAGFASATVRRHDVERIFFAILRHILQTDYSGECRQVGEC